MAEETIQSSTFSLEKVHANIQSIEKKDLFIYDENYSYLLFGSSRKIANLFY